jgi:hypothetical protein
MHRGNGILLGITSYWMLNQASRIKMREKSYERDQFQDQKLQLLFTMNVNFLQHKNLRTSLK